MDSDSVWDGRRGTVFETGHVVLVCPDGAFRRDLMAMVQSAGLLPSVCPDGASAMLAFAEETPDLVVIDLAGLAVDGAAFLQDVRVRWDFPVVALGVRSDEHEEIACLRAGADDYLRRPVELRLLVERMHSRLRRHLKAMKPPKPRRGVDDKVLNRGALNMDERCHLVTWRGRQVALTQTEFALLQALARRPGHVKTREQLLDVAYGDQGDVEDRSIDSHIKRLRKKIRRVDPEFAAIETLYGIGYRYAQSQWL